MEFLSSGTAEAYFEGRYLARKWNEHSFLVVWTSFGMTFLWDWNESWPFQSCGQEFSKFEFPNFEFSKFAGILSAAL